MSISDCRYEWENTRLLRKKGLIDFQKQYQRLKRIAKKPLSELSGEL